MPLIYCHEIFFDWMGMKFSIGIYSPLKLTTKSQAVSAHSGINSWFGVFAEFPNNRKHNATLRDFMSSAFGLESLPERTRS